ncbi:fused isobutyryl-CoA mutase/GTPase IcmF [Aquihabitans sp. McL0605]|uniref:fused isobutyryl-CoA mutase/GTPase IcmF n=1 Tax=Aquihabitans sp. McL0605 TaxID=3415671 RepID=UPI003CFB77CD
MTSEALHQPVHPVRFVTAASLFDGHDASINIMRRILQSQGAEVIHLGHNRSVDEVVTACVQEDVQGVAISSYQGGHVEYFQYLVDLLRERGAGHVKVFGGGGGVIVRSEIDQLHAYGVSRIFSPHDGQSLGLPQMINTLIQAADVELAVDLPGTLDGLFGGDHAVLARVITAIESDTLPSVQRAELRAAAEARTVPVLGITGTGGSGKSSLTDELVRRFRLDHEDKLKVAVIAIDPTRRKGGGALLGDRIRMNSIDPGTIYFRSLATRTAGTVVPQGTDDIVAAAKAWGADLVIIETPGIGQGDAAIVDHVDLSLYVMTPEFGAASQLEKIDMLDFADVVAINKFDRRGGEDALRDVRRQLVRNSESFGSSPDEMPVFGTVASRFNDDGVTGLYQELRSRLQAHGLTSVAGGGVLPHVDTKVSSADTAIVPAARARYLADIAAHVRDHHATVADQAAVARELQQLRAVRALVAETGGDAEAAKLPQLEAAADQRLGAEARGLLAVWPQTVADYSGDEHVIEIRGRELHTQLTKESLSGSKIPRVALPRFTDHGELLRFLMLENLPGRFPFTAGVFPFKRDGERPARMFAGEGDAFKTNTRFHLLSEGQPATRLSTAFDSVTLYGFDPDLRPDIYGKVGNSGVSIATLDDMKVLFDGFDLCDPSTSVSMTINGPAPTILAMFLNTAIDQRLDRFRTEEGREPTAEEAVELRAWVLANVRGTVQADILKEDQGQNTCIFSTEFALGMMADIAEWFVAEQVRNFYSVSISGYHIAEAGANPISQLAFTLSNGFTYVEAYLARGMAIDDFAPNLSFFFSNGMDPEYTVLGRVARRIWAVAMRDRYGAAERSQKLKYHVQTSGRSLHAQEMAFNDIRTTLQALIAIYDNCNSLHTNAYDEAVTTPTAESVRRALAIQLVINEEWGLAMNENPNQGSFIVDELTDLVEAAVLAEFDRIAERGGVLGAMETGYQRGRIQDESLLYETRKHDGTLPLIGVNTFLPPAADDGDDDGHVEIELQRSTDEEKQSQLRRLADFQARHTGERPAALHRLQDAALAGDNLFDVLMDATRSCSLGEITHTLFEVGGRYRRNV